MDNQKINDIALVWDDFHWVGKIHIPSFSKVAVELNVDAEDEEPVSPHEKQCITLSNFVEKSETLYNEVLDEIYKYYVRERPNYEAAGEDCVESMPVLSSKSPLEKMITLNYITFTWPYSDSQVQIGLHYSCVWDVEHGLGIVITGDKITEIGLSGAVSI